MCIDIKSSLLYLKYLQVFVGYASIKLGKKKERQHENRPLTKSILRNRCKVYEFPPKTKCELLPGPRLGHCRGLSAVRAALPLLCGLADPSLPLLGLHHCLAQTTPLLPVPFWPTAPGCSLASWTSPFEGPK